MFTNQKSYDERIELTYWQKKKSKWKFKKQHLFISIDGMWSIYEWFSFQLTVNTLRKWLLLRMCWNTEQANELHAKYARVCFFYWYAFLSRVYLFVFQAKHRIFGWWNVNQQVSLIRFNQHTHNTQYIEWLENIVYTSTNALKIFDVRAHLNV